MSAAIEPGIEQRFDPFSQTWKEAPVWVRIDPTEFARGSVRLCFRAKVLDASEDVDTLYTKLQADAATLPGLTDATAAEIASKLGAALTETPSVADLIAALEADDGKTLHDAIFSSLADDAARDALKAELAAIEVTRPHVESHWKHPGCNRIAKCYIKEGLDVEEVRRATEEDIVCQSVAKAWAAAYNRTSIVPGSIPGVSKANTPKHPPKQVDFVALTLLRLPSRPEDGSRGQSVFALEAVIEGEYRKYNNNAGMLVEDVHRQTPQALSHFAWESSGGRVMLSDVQGVGELLTDPVIHTASGKGFGETNLGIRGMALFFASHLHTPLLELLGLKPFGLSPVEVRRLPALMREFQERAEAKEAGGGGTPAKSDIAFAAGPGVTVTLEEAAEKAAGEFPLGFVDPGADAARDLAAVKTAVDLSLGPVPAQSSRPASSIMGELAALSASVGAAPVHGLAVSHSAIGGSYGIGAADSSDRAPGLSPVKSFRGVLGATGPRSLKRLNSAGAMALARGALGPSSHLLKTHRADTLAQSRLAGAGKVRVALQETLKEAPSGEEGEGTPAAAASSAAGGDESDDDDDDDDDDAGAIAAHPSESMAILSVALPWDATDSSSVDSGAASAVAAASETPASPGKTGGPSFKMLYCAAHFDLAICHANQRLMHFPEVDSSAVGFHLATAAEGYVPAAYVAARIAADETVEPFPDDCIPNSPILSFRWFLRAAMGGNRPAMLRVARLFKVGIEAPAGDDPAIELASWRGLGRFQHEENPAELDAEALWAVSGVKADGQLALTWLEAAIKTDPEADATRAILADPSWRLKAEAAELLAEGGAGLEADPAKAAELYNEAAEAAMGLGKGKAGSKYMRMAAMLEG